MKLKIKKLPHAVDLPKYATSMSSGMDLLAAVGVEGVSIPPLGRALISTGIEIDLSSLHSKENCQNFEAQVRSRSGLALKYGVFVLNSPGTIDTDYRGEISVILMNISNQEFKIVRGMRIAQLVIVPVLQVQLLEVRDLSSSERQNSGFGSTGIY